MTTHVSMNGGLELNERNVGECHSLAPPPGLEPGTYGLTDHRYVTGMAWWLTVSP